MSSTNEGDGGAKWHRAAHVSDIEEHWPCPVDIGGTCIALYRMENGIFATSGWCTHEGAPLSDGYFDAMSATIECPLHQARFHVPTGIVLSAPASEPLRIYPVRVRAGEVYVELRDNEQS